MLAAYRLDFSPLTDHKRHRVHNLPSYSWKGGPHNNFLAQISQAITAYDHFKPWCVPLKLSCAKRIITSVLPQTRKREIATLKRLAAPGHCGRSVRVIIVTSLTKPRRGVNNHRLCSVFYFLESCILGKWNSWSWLKHAKSASWTPELATSFHCLPDYFPGPIVARGTGMYLSRHVGGTQWPSMVIEP
jgi:hypothetical protein